jgi:hypothetical protein
MLLNEKLAILAELEALEAELAAVAIADIARRAQAAGGLVFLMPQAD